MTYTGLVKRQALSVSGQHRPSHVSRHAVDSAHPAKQQMQAQGPTTPTVPAITTEEVDRLKEAARLEGLALGRKQGQEEVEKAAREKLAALDSMITSVGDAWNKERDHLHSLLADFAFVATNRMLGDCLRDPHVALAAVRSALAACEAWQELTVEVHAKDVDMIAGALKLDSSLADKSLRVVASSAVQLGGCRITSPEGSLDARLETQLAQLRACLDAERVEWHPPA